jgi:hypothetical protein
MKAGEASLGLLFMSRTLQRYLIFDICCTRGGRFVPLVNSGVACSSLVPGDVGYARGSTE